MCCLCKIWRNKTPTDSLPYFIMFYTSCQNWSLVLFSLVPLAMGKPCNRDPSVYLFLKYGQESVKTGRNGPSHIQSRILRPGVTVFRSGKSSVAFISITLCHDCIQDLRLCFSESLVFDTFHSGRKNPDLCSVTVRHFSLFFSPPQYKASSTLVSQSLHCFFFNVPWQIHSVNVTLLFLMNTICCWW